MDYTQDWELLFALKVQTHPAFCGEFEELIEHTGIQTRVMKLLLVRITMIHNMGIEALCAQQGNNYEKLKGDGRGLYSLHLQGNNMNYRVLLSALDDGAILLHSFYEREGKKNTGYHNAIPIAQERLREFTESMRFKGGTRKDGKYKF